MLIKILFLLPLKGLSDIGTVFIIAILNIFCVFTLCIMYSFIA